MKPSLFALLAVPFALAIGCSSTGEDSSTSEDELRGAAACKSKSCGDACTLCPPGKSDCFETAVLKQCDATGLCKPAKAICGASDAGSPPPGYDACAGKACGASCTICPPGDPDCFETAVLKQCNATGECAAAAAVCGPADAGPAPYEPCAGKACGASCTICPPGEPGCFETAVVKQCDASGVCSANASLCK